MIISQISVFVENRPGTLAEVLGVLKEHAINLRALSVADTADFGILRMVADQPDAAVKLLKESGFTARETDVIGVEVPDQPGALASIMALFRDEGVNIEYLYASLEHKAEKAVIVLKVDDIAAGLAMLQKNGVSTIPSF